MGEFTRRRYLTIEEASDITGYKPNTLSIMARQGRIPAVKVGRRWRFLESELIEWIESKREGSSHE